MENNEENLKDWLKRYRALTDIIYESEDELQELEVDINAYVDNPACHGIFSKNYLPSLEKRRDKLRVILEGLELLRDKMRDE